MPNKRKEGRRTASVVLDDETWLLLKKEADKLGTNISNLLEKLATEKLGEKNEKDKSSTEDKTNLRIYGKKTK